MSSSPNMIQSVGSSEHLHFFFRQLEQAFVTSSGMMDGRADGWTKRDRKLKGFMTQKRHDHCNLLWLLI